LNACVGRRECAFSVGAMPAKSKKKSKNRALEEKIAPAQSQLDQIKLNESKELDQKTLDLAMRRVDPNLC
jgi:hypothetical protein